MTRVVAVVGPTATGKSSLAVRVAAEVGGEIVNADSMQLYRGMDIGTAKLPAAERHGITHHLLDVWDVTRTASAADYQELARGRIEDLLSRDITPVLVGGSGLYLRAALDDIDFPGTDPRLRAGLEQQLAADGTESLHRRLAELDPVTAAIIPAANGRRVVRALEVVLLTGHPYTSRLPAYTSRYDVTHVGLDLPTEELDARVEARMTAMLAAGFEAEVRALDATGLRAGVTASRALGYAQLLEVIDGTATVAQATAATARATRRFVRRQRSWFRRDPRIHWVDGRDTDAALTVALAEPPPAAGRADAVPMAAVDGTMDR